MDSLPKINPDANAPIDGNKIIGIVFLKDRCNAENANNALTNVPTINWFGKLVK